MALLVLGIIGTFAIAPIHATYFAVASARVDKSSYLPGDSGTLYVTVRNTGTQAVTVKNITIVYPWMAYITDHWEGNTTILNINQPLSQNQNYNGQFSFTIPTDGRGHSGDISITVATDVPEPSQYSILYSSAFIQVAGATFQPFGLTTSILPIISIVLLAIAVLMLALVWMGISKLQKKQ